MKKRSIGSDTIKLLLNKSNKDNEDVKEESMANMYKHDEQISKTSEANVIFV